MAKSARAAPIAAPGITSRGKYTFVTRLALVTRLVLLVLTAFEKKVHGRIPAYAKMAYGSPSDGTRATRPKTSVKITIVSAGCRTAHSTPSTVCWYRTFSSFQVR